MPSILRTNSLLFPANRTARFNFAHPAAKGIGKKRGFAFVPSGSRYVDLVSAYSAWTVFGSPNPAATINGAFGPGSIFTGAQALFDNAGTFQHVLDNEFTLSGFFLCTSVSTRGAIVATASNTGEGSGLEIATTGGLLLYQAGSGASVQTSTACIASLNTPYFGMVSGSAAGSIVNFLLLNLLTGKITSETLSVTVNTGATSGQPILGGSPASNSIVGTIGPTSFTPSFLTMTQLKDWARTDPYALWYPSYKDNFFMGIATAGGAVAANLRMLRGMGT